MKPTKCPARQKKTWGKKSEKRGKERKRKVTFKPKNFVFWASRTTQADILHLDQKAVKRTTCKRVCGKF